MAIKRSTRARKYCVLLRPKGGGEVVDRRCFSDFLEAEDQARANRRFWKVSITEVRPAKRR